MKSILYIAIFLIAGCASHPPFNPVVGNTVFQSYVKESLSGKRSDERSVNLRNAYRGDPKGLQYFFGESYQRSMSSIINPAEEVGLGWILTTLLVKNGDQLFSQCLAKEPPEVQSAVFSFLRDYHIPENYFYTQELMRSSPNIKFPLEEAYEKLG